MIMYEGILMKESVQEQLREFIFSNFLFGDSEDALEDSDSLIEKGVIDSTGVLELVSFIEETYGIRVEDDELVPENLDTIADLTAYVLKKHVEAQEA